MTPEEKKKPVVYLNDFEEEDEDYDDDDADCYCE